MGVSKSFSITDTIIRVPLLEVKCSNRILIVVFLGQKHVHMNNRSSHDTVLNKEDSCYIFRVPQHMSVI